MAQNGKIQVTFVISAPPEQVAEGDRLFNSHAPWLEATHPRTGDMALLSYNVSKAPELSNPLDPSSKPTGNTCFVISEVYESPSAVADHVRKASEGWQDFPALLQWMEKCKVTVVPAAPIIKSLW